MPDNRVCITFPSTERKCFDEPAFWVGMPSNERGSPLGRAFQIARDRDLPDGTEIAFYAKHPRHPRKVYIYRYSVWHHNGAVALGLRSRPKRPPKWPPPRPSSRRRRQRPLL